MFDKLQQAKALIRLRQQAKRLQEELEQVFHTEESEQTKVTVNGAQKIVAILVDGKERTDLKDLINRAMTEVQKKSAKKMMQTGGLSGLLGGLGK